MNILFVHSVERRVSRDKPTKSSRIQLGISYISAVLKRAGHSTELLVLSSEDEAQALALAVDKVRRRSPAVVALTCVSSQYPFIDKVAREIRRARPETALVIGGPHASLAPGQVATSVYDAICIGEGEYPMSELVAQLATGKRPAGIQNLWLRRQDGSMEKNRARPFLQDLDELPFPDRDMWTPWIDDTDFEAPPVLLGRGCPCICTYCSNHALSKLADGRYVRFRSPGKIVEEIKGVRGQLPKDKPYVYLEVETIALDKGWALKMCEALRCYNATLPEPLKYHCNFRIMPQSLDEEIFRALAAANVCRLNIGLEAGSERVRREALKRNYSNEDFLKAVDLARRNGMAINLFNMIGVPGETLQDHMETVRLNREARPSLSYTSIFYPYPGTELYKVCEERGLIPRNLDTSREREHPVLDLPEFPRRDVQKAYDLFEWRIYKGIWPLHVRLRKLIRKYIAKSTLGNAAFTALMPIWRFLSKISGIDRSFGRNVPG
jgi:radical SAM superfamily enzyme YgiQ (UPF0313 family)